MGFAFLFWSVSALTWARKLEVLANKAEVSLVWVDLKRTRNRNLNRMRIIAYFIIEGFPALSLLEANFLAIVLDNLFAISASLTSVSFDLSSAMAAACSAIMDSISLFIPK